LVGITGGETTSEYQARYRSTLIQRRQWTPLASAGSSSDDVIVRRAGYPAPAPTGYVECFRDHRFVAYRKDRGSP
jgi:hypothetical protein